MNTAEYLNTLIECKEDMKAAIEERGITITGGLSTYADAIEEIEWDFRDVEVIYIPNGVNIGFYAHTNTGLKLPNRLAFDVTDCDNFTINGSLDDYRRSDHQYAPICYKLKQFNVDGNKIIVVFFE